MTESVASIIGKTIKGQTYYYLREVARVGGKPKIVSQRYLGKAADIEAEWTARRPCPSAPAISLSVTGRPPGGCSSASGYEQSSTTWSDAGASVGTYIALATLNRVCDPCSKLAFSDWWGQDGR